MFWYKPMDDLPPAVGKAHDHLPIYFLNVWVPRNADRWRWSIFNSHTAWAHYVWDEYLSSVLYGVEVRVTVCLTVCVV